MEKNMAAEQDHDPSPTPKLSLFFFPSEAQESQEMLTPPIHSQASVPFQWEEAPGKPRLSSTNSVDRGDSKPKVERCLELPPRLFTESKVSISTASPITVLDRSYVGNLSLRNTLSFRSPMAEKNSKEKVSFASSRWGSVTKSKQKEEIVGGSFDFLPPEVNDGSHSVDRDGTKVKITRVTERSDSLTSVSRTKSQILLNIIYESFKQVVPWSRRKQEKWRKTNSN